MRFLRVVTLPTSGDLWRVYYDHLDFSDMVVCNDCGDDFNPDDVDEDNRCEGCRCHTCDGCDGCGEDFDPDDVDGDSYCLDCQN